MNSEESRLRTFANWPEDAVIDPRRIAKAGFYYMGQGLEVQCFSCGGRIAEWNYGDKVMAKHISLDPRCPFVVNPVHSGNVPLDNSSSRNSPFSHAIPHNTRANRSAMSPYRSEEVRLATFNTWPLHDVVSPVKLAKSGFYYTQKSDRVQCAYCNGVLYRWIYGDEPADEHQRYFPTCPFINGRASSQNSGVDIRDSRIEATDIENLKELGVLSHRIPVNTRYSTYESRLRSFENWPPTLCQKPEQLAEAGFYFTGNRDKVRCFHCDGGLQLWEKDDEPWLEHAKWFRDCGYVLLTKGQDFIDEAIKSFAPSINKAEKNLDANRLPMLKKNFTVTEAELQDLMNSPQAVSALQVGIEASRVKLAIKFNKEITGQHFNNADDLIIAALDVQTEENSSLDQEESWSTPPMSPAFGSRRINPRNVITPVTSDDSDEDYQEENSCIKRAASDNCENLNTKSKMNPFKSGMSLEEENRRLKEARLCKICMDNEVEIVLLPCGHLVTCINCSHSLIDCPLCRQPIRATVRTFLS